jgi:hypothetical protein
MKARRVKNFVLIVLVKCSLGYYLLIPQNRPPVKCEPPFEAGRDSGEFRQAGPRVLRKGCRCPRKSAIHRANQGEPKPRTWQGTIAGSLRRLLRDCQIPQPKISWWP